MTYDDWKLQASPTPEDAPELHDCHDCEGEYLPSEMGTPQLCKRCMAELERVISRRCRAGTCGHVDSDGWPAKCTVKGLV